MSEHPDRRPDTLHRLDLDRQALRERHATGANPRQHHIARAAAAVDDLAGHPSHDATHLVGVQYAFGIGHGTGSGVGAS